MKVQRAIVAICLSALLTVGPKMGFAAENTLPADVFRFKDMPPSADYYDRSFVPNWKDRGVIKDATSLDSDQVINSYPQAERGFMPSWLKRGQSIAPLIKITEVVMTDGAGKRVRARLSIGEVVVYHAETLDILAVYRCGNKVTEGEIELPVPEVRIVTVEKPVERIVERPVTVERIVERPVETVREVCVQGAWLDVLERGDARGKLGKKFLASQEISRLTIANEIYTQASRLRTEEVKYLLVQQGACPEERGRLRVRWLTKDGWHWKEFWVGTLVGFGAGFATGWFTRGPRETVRVVEKVITKPPGSPPPRPGFAGTAPISGIVSQSRAAGRAALAIKVLN